MAMPYSLRQPFKTVQEARMINDFVAIPVKIPICKDFDTALEKIKAYFESLKGSIDVYGTYETFNATANLPFTMPR
jgi:hypothetical protein